MGVPDYEYAERAVSTLAHHWRCARAVTHGREHQRLTSWSAGQQIFNDVGARMPEHTFRTPVPITTRIVWADDRLSQPDRQPRRSLTKLRTTTMPPYFARW
jgi:hypothetical protein